jgi:hypothetical protein
MSAGAAQQHGATVDRSLQLGFVRALHTVIVVYNTR